MRPSALLLICLFVFGINTSAFANTIVYVTQNGAGAKDGSSWTNALDGANLKTSLDNSGAGTDFWVAAGTYYPGASGDNTASFSIKKGINLYGGFNGTESSLTERNVSANATILSGDLDQSNSHTSNDAYNVVTSFGVNQDYYNFVFDGFTVQWGNATNGADAVQNKGAAMHLNMWGQPQIISCTFKSNYGVLGGSVYAEGAALPDFRDCAFVGNNTFGYGAAVYYYSLASIYYTNFVSHFTNCIFTNNGSTYYGIVTFGYARAAFMNCSFNNNSGHSVLWNLDNFYSELQVTNTIVWDNMQAFDGQFTVNYSDIRGGWAGNGSHNIDVDPNFANAQLELKACSQAIDAGTNSGAPSNDYLGHTRPYNGGTADMGAYEYQGNFSGIPAPSISAGNTVLTCAGGSASGVLLTSSNATGNQWYRDGVLINGATNETYSAPFAGIYTLQVTTNNCTSPLSAPVTVTYGSTSGDPSVFGDHVWNVYAWDAGGANINSQAWNANYRGYYTETALSFDTRNKWGGALSPSNAPGYQGCPVNVDKHSWSAKRKGFTCGNYKINIGGHDDAAQLFVNGTKVWEHDGCCDPHDDVWEGYLDDNATVEFRVTEGDGNSYGVISLIPPVSPVVTPDGPTTVCNGTVSLNSNIATGNQWFRDGVAITDATSQSYTATVSGAYTVQVPSDACPFMSDPVTVTIKTPVGDPTVFGQNAWNVYAWNGTTWSGDYKGYYTDNQLNFNSQSNWPVDASPSAASNYQGCDLNVENHSWSAKRQGFPCGHYRIDVVGHDDDALLYINNELKWSHTNGCCDPHAGVWEGDLGPNSKVEFKVMDIGGSSQGAINIVYLSAAPATPTVSTNNGATCSIGSMVLTSSSTYGNQWFKDGEAIAGATAQTYTATVSGTYSVQVTLDGCGNANSTPLSITVAPASDPAVFGQNVWNVYAWNDGNGLLSASAWQNNYRGYYTESALSFDTRNKWGSTLSPSSAPGYQGCPVNVDNHSWSAKRQGFPCGQYNITVTAHDDGTQLWVNGVKVKEAFCCNVPNLTWQGLLDANSTIEFRCTEGLGDSYGAISITQTLPTITAVGSTTICPGASVILNSSLATGNQWYKDGQTITGATSQSYTATVPGAYTVQMTSDACGNASNTITVNSAVKGDPSVFGQNAWNVYAWNSGGSEVNTNTWTANYSGYYVDNTLNFNTGNRWGSTGSPSSASGYLGCPVGFDNHSWSAKRQGFSCGYYKLYASHDDAAELWVDGVKVWERSCCNTFILVWEGFLGANSKVEFRVTEGVGDSYGSLSFYAIEPAINTSGTTSLCSGESVTLTSSFTSGNQWYKDGEAIPGATNSTYTATTAGGYSVKSGPSECVQTSNTIAVAVSQPAGDNSAFGQNVWNVYAWNSGAGTLTSNAWQDKYRGYYTESAVSFDTRTKWDQNSSPSFAAGYQGCPVVLDRHSWSAKRQGFPCGRYSISIPWHDDAAQLFVNGTKVWEHDGCCDEHKNVWTGFLDAGTTIEFRGTDGAGLSGGVINIAPELITASGPTTVCNSAIDLTLTAEEGTNYSWNTGASSQAIHVTQPGTYSVTVVLPNGCTQTSSQEVKIGTIPDAPALSLYPGTTLCSDYGYVEFSITNYDYNNTYEWSTTDGSSIDAYYNYADVYSSGTYKLVVTNADGCKDSVSQTINATSPNDATVFGSNKWNVYAFNNQYDYNTDKYEPWTPSGYAGYYTENSLSFDTRDRWNPDYGSPSDASGYSGCPVYSDYHSWSAKRKGLPCGHYKISIPGYNDDAELIINGTSVWQKGCCSLATNPVWEGDLGPNSEVEFRGSDFYGSSFGSILFETTDAAVVAKPVVTPSGATNLCQGESLILSLSSPANNLWSNGETGQSITVNESGNYSVTITGNEGCTAQSDPVQVNVNNLPTPVIANNSNTSVLTCTTPSIGLAASGGSSYSWSIEGSTIGTSANLNVTTPGTYTVAVTNENNCSATESIAITEDKTAPSAAITASRTVLTCTNPTATLTGSGNGMYAWSTGATTAQITVNTDGLYTLTVTGSNGCTSQDAVAITADKTPPGASIAAATNVLTCATPSIQLTANGNGSFAWSTGTSTASITVSSPGTYTVTVTGTNGCTSQASIVITKNTTLPSIPTASSNSPVCAGLTLNLSATLVANATYKWTGPNGFSSTQRSPSISNATAANAGTYTVVAISTVNGCQSSAVTTTVTINANPAPTVTASGPTTFCQGGSVTLTAQKGFKSYKWNTGATTQSITVSTSGSYTVTGTNSNGCLATSAPVMVTVNPLPTQFTVTGGGSYCSSGSGVAIGLSGSQNGVSYQLFRGSTALGTIPGSGSPISFGNQTVAGTYTVKATNSAGCTATMTGNATVSVLPLPSVTIPNAFAYRYGAAANTVYNGWSPASTLTLTASVNGGASPYSYVWKKGNQTVGTSSSFIVTTAATYTVTVTDSKGCSSSASKVVTSVNVSCNAGAGVSICQTSKKTGPMTKCLPPNNVDAALKDGATLGACSSTATKVMVTVSQPQTQTSVTDQRTVQLSPNPATNNVRVGLKGYTGKVVLQLADIQGKLLWQRQFHTTGSEYVQQLDLAKLAGGTYLLVTVDEKGNRHTEKLVITR